MAGAGTRSVLLFAAAVGAALIGAACTATPAPAGGNSRNLQVRSADSVGVQAPAPNLQPSDSDLGQSRGQNAAPPTNGQVPPAVGPQQSVPPGQSGIPPAARCTMDPVLGPSGKSMPRPGCLPS
jgi:hypothetical protein